VSTGSDSAKPSPKIKNQAGWTGAGRGVRPDSNSPKTFTIFSILRHLSKNNHLGDSKRGKTFWVVKYLLELFFFCRCSCWLRNHIAFYVGVVAYFLLIFVLCLLVFIVVMIQLSRVKKQNPQNQQPNRGVMADLRSVAGLVTLLGLTWGFALFAWGPLYLPFVYLFTIFNSLQGETCMNDVNNTLLWWNRYVFLSKLPKP